MQEKLSVSAEQKPNSDAGKQRVSLDAPGVAKALSKRILSDIDDYCVKTYDGGHRWHLGASLIGHECSRYLWYVFRWTFREPTDGRKQRLFNRGHREEARFIEWLEGIGAQIWYENREGLMYHPESDSYFIATGNESGADFELSHLVRPEDAGYSTHVGRAKLQGVEFPQYRISAVMGHFGGSLDGIVKLPERYGIDEPLLAEFKTNGTGKGFSDLLTSGMTLAKPQHYAQTSTYGNEYKFNYVAYFNICKNDDDLHVEVVKLDHKLGEQMKAKAERIILSQQPPARLSDNPTYHKCGYCAAKEICHNGKAPEMNCRSCAKAYPVENGEWLCAEHSGVIPREFVPNGCPAYAAITMVK